MAKPTPRGRYRDRGQTQRLTATQADRWYVGLLLTEDPSGTPLANQLGVELCPFLELIQENPFILRVRLSDVPGAQYQQLFHLP